MGGNELNQAEVKGSGVFTVQYKMRMINKSFNKSSQKRSGQSHHYRFSAEGTF